MFAFKRALPSALRRAIAQADTLTCHVSDRVICLTRQDVETAANSGIPVDNFVVIPNGIEVGRFITPNDRRAEFGFEVSTPVVGMISRLAPQKDPLTFVRMARHVADAVPEARFLLVGDGALRPAGEQAVRNLGLEQWLTITGFRSDVPELLATMDVVVLSSLWEGLPIVVLEAMAAARPVVATALPGLEEVIVDGETGVLVPAQDPARVAAAVVSLIRDPHKRRVIGWSGRERARHEFTIGRITDYPPWPQGISRVGMEDAGRRTTATTPGAAGGRAG